MQNIAEDMRGWPGKEPIDRYSWICNRYSQFSTWSLNANSLKKKSLNARVYCMRDIVEKNEEQLNRCLFKLDVFLLNYSSYFN